MTFTTPSVSEIIQDQLYLGNLSSAQSVELLERLRITHILSVCPELPTLPTPHSKIQHLCIPVQDTEYEDLLIHLPKACQFIEQALKKQGRVLVHCVMGISRSSTVVAGYLMKVHNLSASDAIRKLKSQRPQVHLNYGFTKQLDVYKKCDFKPSPSNPAYRSWKMKCEQDVSSYLGHVHDTVEIVQDKVLLCSEFPSDTQQARSFLQDLGVTHLLSISPAEVSIEASSIANHHHITLNSSRPNEGLLLALPDICDWITKSLTGDNLVLIHSLMESRACTVACAYLMKLRKQSAAQAFRTIEDTLPLFNPTRSFTQCLEVFQACKCRPTADHPKVKEWISFQRGINTKRPSSVFASGNGSGGVNGKQSDLAITAKNILSETGYDLKAFADAINTIQMKS